MIESRPDWLGESDFDRRVSWFLIIATYWRRYDARYPTAHECRRALQRMTDLGRESALWTVGEAIAGQDGWIAWARKFFQEIWPQETKFQTGGTSGAMVDIAARNPANFRDIVDLILEYLQPHEHPHGFLYKSQQKTDGADGRSVVERHPSSALAVADKIIGPVPEHYPFDLGAFLEKIAEVDADLKKSPSWRRLYELPHR